jgi:predicted DNA-binding protein with PD1-like motif
MEWLLNPATPPFVGGGGGGGPRPPPPTALDGPFEILALNGTLGPEGAHLHAALADADGRVTGGHVLAGCVVHTTVELAIGVLPDLAFGRRPDPDTGHDELTVAPRPGA